MESGLEDKFFGADLFNVKESSDVQIKPVTGLNDICSIQSETGNLIDFDGTMAFSQIFMQKEAKARKSFEYTLSTWIKLDSETKQQKKGYKAAKNAFIMKYDEVFTLYHSKDN